MLFDIPKNKTSIIKVIGVGGGGGNAVAHMYNQGITGVEFAICNTDNQAIESSPIPTQIQLGPHLTEGMGAGSKPEIGKQACIESIDEVRNFLSDGTKMLFITAGMGGGTGTGAAPIIAKAAKEMGVLTVGIVTIPFKFEGMRRHRHAIEGLEQLKKNVDSILVISNDKVKEIYGNLTLKEAFAEADNILTTAAKGIAEIITIPGYVNVDFEDVNTVMKDSGVSIMGNATADGDDRARKAIYGALNSPLLEDNDIRGAQHILLNITSGTKEVTMDEISEITDYVQEEAGYGTDLIWGNCTDPDLGDKISITLIATGFEEGKAILEESKPEIKKVTVPLDDIFINEQNESIVESLDLTETNSEYTFDFDTPEVPTSSNSQREYKARETSIEEKVIDERRKVEISKEEEMDRARREYQRKSTSKPLDNANIISDMEKVPAYLRRSIELDEVKQSNAKGNLSEYTIGVEDELGHLRTSNSFLHNNAD